MTPPTAGRLQTIVLACLIARAASAAEPGPPPRTLWLGLSLPGLETPAVLPDGDAEHPVDVRLTADWEGIERARGEFDWSKVQGAIATLRAHHARVTLCLRGDNPLYPAGDRRGEAPEAAWLEAWTAFSRSAVRSLGTDLAVLEIGEHPERDFNPHVYAFVLKSAALGARAEAKAAGVTLEIAQGVVDAGALAWEKDLLANDAAAYVDALPIEIADGDPAPVITGFLSEAVLHPPAPRIRVLATGGPGAWGSFATAVEALAAGAPTAFASLPPDPALADPFVRATFDLSARLSDGFSPAPTGALAMKTPAGDAAADAAVIGRFLHAVDFATLVVYRAPLSSTGETQARLVLDTVDVKEPAVIDLVGGASYKTGPAPVPGVSKRALRLLLSDHPMAVAWQRVSENVAGLETAPEDVEVKSSRGLTAQEIIARNQEVQKIQDDRLDRWMAEGRVDIHAKIAQGGGSIDVGIESSYFWQRGHDLEWRQKNYYFNGNRVRWKKIPELPLIQPEKVATLPLDLTLDKTYDYRLVGEDTVSARPAYVLAFEPAAEVAARSLYRGRVWIDKETFVRLRTSVVQTHVEAPILQAEETDTYVQVSAPGGGSVTVIEAVDGQQLWTAAGRNFVIRKQYQFHDFAINPPKDGFDAALSEAYASDDQMLRDTDKGFRYLEKSGEGGRTVRDTLKTSSLLAGGGLFKDSSIPGVVPLAGVNWFDYDFLKKKMQFNVFFAGVYAFVNFTDPALAGTRVDLGVEASLVGLKLDEKYFVNGDEDLTQRLRRRSQYLTGRFGHPLGNFFKVALIADLTFNTYSDSSEGRDALAAQNAANGTSLVFVLPPDHTVLAGTAQLEFNRKGYSVTGAASYSRRSQWERWGLFDTTTGQFQDTTFDPGQKEFESWRLTGFKEWYLPKFQKFKVELDALGGANMDRFSEYQFSTFGDQSLEGFAGTGVRFDTGYIGRLGYAFNILNAVRFDLAVESARVRDSLADPVFRNHTGAGISFNVVGPWKTVWQGSYGRALASGLEGLVGKQEFQVFVLKLF